MNKQNLTRLLDKISQISWAIFLLALPVTSFPYFPGGLGGMTLIRPLSVYPLLVLIPLVTLPRLFKGPLPKTFLPLLAFIVIALMSSVLGLSFGPDVFKGVSITSRVLRNIITLGIGSAIYLTVSLYPRTWKDMNAVLRWIYAGFGIALSWGSLQSIYIIYSSPTYFKWISKLQRFISTRKLFANRISGMTYEPKWFAEQICFLLLPWLLSSVIQKRSVFKWRWRRITIEWILLAWSVVVLIFTFSRTGFLILIYAASLSMLLLYLQRRKKAGVRRGKTAAEKRRVWLRAGLLILLVVVIIGAAGTQNRYFSRFWRYWGDQNRPANETYLEYIAVNQRLVYWQTAFRMYQAYPILGVGLGNYAFHFEQMLPDQSWHRSPEILRQITPIEGAPRLITTKNMYVRLLAETGLLGTITFITFVIAVLGCALALWSSASEEEKFWGLSGLLGVAIFVVVIMSVDSFAIPNMWVVFGIITAAAHISQEEPVLPTPKRDEDPSSTDKA